MLVNGLAIRKPSIGVAALRYADGAKDKELIQRLQEKFDFLFTEEKILQPIMIMLLNSSVVFLSNSIW